MSTITSTSASFVRPVSPTGADTHRPGIYVSALVAVAAATIIAVAAIWLLWPTSDSSSISTRTVQSTTAAELTIRPSFAHTGPVVRRATAPATVRSANAAELGVPVASSLTQSATAAELGL